MMLPKSPPHDARQLVFVLQFYFGVQLRIRGYERQARLTLHRRTEFIAIIRLVTFGFASPDPEERYERRQIRAAAPLLENTSIYKLAMLIGHLLDPVLENDDEVLFGFQYCLNPHHRGGGNPARCWRAHMLPDWDRLLKTDRSI